jgi:hypothetical protein
MPNNTRYYEPTHREIAEGCTRIQAGWSRHDRQMRKVRKPVVRPWTPPVIVDVVDARGEYVLITGDSHCA